MIPNRIKENIDLRRIERYSILGMSQRNIPRDIYNFRFWNPHEEMRKCVEMYDYNSLAQSAVNSLVKFIVGGELRVVSKDEKTRSFLQAKIDGIQLDIKAEEIVENTIKTGNGYAEIEFNKETGAPCDLYPLADSSRMYINCDSFGKPLIGINGLGEKVPNLKEFYLQEVDPSSDIANASNFRISYFIGGKYNSIIIKAIPIPKNNIISFKLNVGNTGIYGRSFLASALNDNEILVAIEKALAVLAKYRSVPRKLIQIGEHAGEVDEKETQDFINYFESLQPEENPIVNKPVKMIDLSFAGRDINMDYMINHVRKKIIAGLAPEFLLGLGDETNRATAKEQLVAFLLAVTSLRKKFLRPLEEGYIKPLIKYHNNIGMNLDTSAYLEFGDLDFETKLEKIQRITTMWNNNEISFNEMRDELGYSTIGKEGDIYHDEYQQKIQMEAQMKAQEQMMQQQAPQQQIPQEESPSPYPLPEELPQDNFEGNSGEMDAQQNMMENIKKKENVNKPTKKECFNSNQSLIDLYCDERFHNRKKEDGIVAFKEKVMRLGLKEDLNKLNLQEAERHYLKERLQFPFNPSKTIGLERKYAKELKDSFDFVKRELIGNLKTYKESYNKQIRLEATLGQGFLEFVRRKFSEILNKVDEKIGVALIEAYDKGQKNILKQANSIKTFSFKEYIQKAVVENMKYVYNLKNYVLDKLSDLIQEGLTQGDSITTITDNISESFNIVKSRAETIARTEVIKAYNTAEILTGKELGFKKMKWLTGWDDRVCEGEAFNIVANGKTYHNCREMRNEVFNINDAPIPAKDTHPRCRCCLITVIDGGQ